MVTSWRETPIHIYAIVDRVAHRAGRIPTMCIVVWESMRYALYTITPRRLGDDKNLMQEEIRVSEYDGGFNADNRNDVVGGFDIETVEALREKEDSQPRTFRHAFFEAVLRGNTDQYWAKRGHTPIEAIGEVYEKELAEVGK